MTRREKTASQPDALRAALESWDPTRREDAPPDPEVARLRRRVLAERRRPAAGRPRWRPVLATAAAVLLAVLVHRGLGPSATRGVAPPSPAAVDEAARPRSASQPIAGPAEPDRQGPRPPAPGGVGSGEGSPAGPSPGDRRGDRPATAPAAPSPERLAAAAGTVETEAHRAPPEARAAIVARTTNAARETGAAGNPASPATGEPVLVGAAETAETGEAGGADPSPQRIQLIAPGGTRIVWLVAGAPPGKSVNPS